VGGGTSGNFWQTTGRAVVSLRGRRPLPAPSTCTVKPQSRGYGYWASIQHLTPSTPRDNPDAIDYPVAHHACQSHARVQSERAQLRARVDRSTTAADPRYTQVICHLPPHLPRESTARTPHPKPRPDRHERPSLCHRLRPRLIAEHRRVKGSSRDQIPERTLSIP